MNMEQQTKLLRADEVAKLLGVKESTVRSWIFFGRLRTVKIGKRAVRIPADWLEKFIENNTQFERRERVQR